MNMALKPNPVNWFEIPVNDLSRATKFYESIFDVELSLNEMGPTKMAWFPMEREGSGASGTLLKGEGYNPTGDGTLVYFSVDDIESVLNKVNKNGGKTLEGKMAIGEHGFIGIFQDSEGNRVGLHSMK
jgi:predicted enzyme related to lactoylglutathione lyase